MKGRLDLDNDFVVAILLVAMFPVGFFIGYLIAYVFDVFGLP